MLALATQNGEMGDYRRFGDCLVESGYISRDQLNIALHEQKETQGMLGSILLRLGFINEGQLTELLALRANVPSIDLTSAAIDINAAAIVPGYILAKYAVIPFSYVNRVLEIAMADPLDVLAVDEIRRHFPKQTAINIYAAPKTAIEGCLKQFLGNISPLEGILCALELRENTAADQPHQHPIVRLVDSVIQSAVEQGASDIHFEPENTFVRIRYRIDGALRQVRSLHVTHWSAISHRIKIMSGMDIADTRGIQDGRFQMNIGGGDVDFRVASMPTVWGETIVIRILDHRKSLLPLASLGYSKEGAELLNAISQKPQGITFVTGPTGSGKTTTLYSVLRQISSEEVHVATLEDPVEFQLDLIRQTAIHEAQGINFASGVRGILRMDPDIIFIGEIRDSETAQMAIRAAMTGHQVYTTLHCNDVFGAIPRLIDLGLSPRILAGNISGIIAQRLVRKLCPHCKQSRRANEQETRLLKPYVNFGEEVLIAEPKGCSKCNHTGRKGRTVIAEVLSITPDINDLIAIDADRPTLVRAAHDAGFRSLQEDGLRRILAKEIALNDLCRAVDMSCYLTESENA